jgi:hypothetical protein
MKQEPEPPITLTTRMPDGRVRQETFATVREAERAKRRWKQEGAVRITERRGGGDG